MNAYRKLCTEFYDISKPSAPEGALSYYMSFVREVDGPVLEPMCGSGRFLAPLLEHGTDIHGVDASPEMLAACRARCEAKGFQPTLRRQFLHELDMPGPYSAAFIAGASIGLIADPVQAREGLRRIHDQLAPGGRLALEIDTLAAAPKSSGNWRGRWVDRPDCARIVLSSVAQYDPATHVNRSVNRYELVKDGRLIDTEFEDLEMRYYDPAEFKALLESVGFRDVRPLGVVIYDGRKAGPDDESMVFLGRK